MRHANTEERSSLIVGLRDLAGFLEAREEIPAPRWAEVFVFPLSDADDEMKREIDVIASLIGSSVEDRTTENRHYATSRSFGPVQYRGVAIPSSSRSYRNEEA